MRDSFVLVFLLVLLCFLAYIAHTIWGTERQLRQIQHEVSSTVKPFDYRETKVIKQLAAGKILIPPPPPYVVTPDSAQ